MTGSQLLSQIRTILDETETGGLFTDAEIYTALSVGQLAVYGTLLPFQPEGQKVIAPLVNLERTQALSAPPSSVITSNDGVPVLTLTCNINFQYSRILAFDISVRDGIAQQTYIPSRILKVSSLTALLSDWGLRAITGRQPDVYYYVARTGANNAVTFAVAYSNYSNALESPVARYLVYPSDISGSTTDLEIIGFDDEIINHAVANLLAKERHEFSKLYMDKFVNGLNTKIQVGYALQMQNSN